VRASSGDARAFKVDRCVAPDGTRGKLRLRASSPAEAAAWMATFSTAVADLAGAATIAGADPTPRLRTRSSEKPSPPSSAPASPRRPSPAASPRDSNTAAAAAARLARATLDPPPPPAAPPPRAARLTVEWISCADETNGRVYFVHRPTGAAQWDLPPGWATASSGWAARSDAHSGHTYYFYPPTGETSWELPER